MLSVQGEEGCSSPPTPEPSTSTLTPGSLLPLAQHPLLQLQAIPALLGSLWEHPLGRAAGVRAGKSGGMCGGSAWGRPGDSGAASAVPAPPAAPSPGKRWGEPQSPAGGAALGGIQRSGRAEGDGKFGESSLNPWGRAEPQGAPLGRWPLVLPPPSFTPKTTLKTPRRDEKPHGETKPLQSRRLQGHTALCVRPDTKGAKPTPGSAPKISIRGARLSGAAGAPGGADLGHPWEGEDVTVPMLHPK